MSRINERQVFYLLIILAAGFFLHLANEIPTMMRVEGDPGPGFLPFWISTLIMLLVGYLLVMETVLKKRADDVVRLSRHEGGALVVTLLSIVLYLVLLSAFGFFASTIAFLFAFRLIVDKFINDALPTPGKLASAALFAVISTTVIYLVFSVLFELSLP